MIAAVVVLGRGPWRIAWIGPAIVAVTIVLGSAACGRRTPHCPPAGATVVLRATLTRLAPSPPFTVGVDTRVWVSTPSSADRAAILTRFAGVATVAAFTADGRPSLSRDRNGFEFPADPYASLRKAGNAAELDIGPGRYRLYTVTLGISTLPVEVVTCPR